MINKALDTETLKKCRRCPQLGKDHVPAEGSSPATLMIVGQSPGTAEVEDGRPFCGPSGELVDYLLDEIGIDRSLVYITNAIKCHPPGNRPGDKEELDTCAEHWLSKELKCVNPKIIVMLGKDAWYAVTKGNIPFGNRNVHKGKKRVFVTLYHPSYFLRRGDVEGFVEAGKLLKELVYG